MKIATLEGSAPARPALEVPLLAAATSGNRSKKPWLHAEPGRIAVVACVAAVLGFARNLSIEFSTGILWDAATDSPHTGARGYSLWTHLTCMLIWVAAAVYQFGYSGAIVKARRLRLSAAVLKAAGSRARADAAPNANDAGLCAHSKITLDRAFAAPLLHPDPSARLATRAVVPDATEVNTAESHEDYSPQVLTATYGRHRFVGYCVGLPALGLGGFAGAVWWQNTFGAPITSPVWWYTVGLFVSSFGHLLRGIWHARRIKKPALLLSQLSSTSATVLSQEQGLQLSAEEVEDAKLQHLALHQLYSLVAVVWSVDPGLHRIVFWTRVLVLYFPATRALFYPASVDFADACADPAAHLAVLSLGKLPVNLACMALVVCYARVRERDCWRIHEARRVIAGNLALLSFWFWGSLLLQGVVLLGDEDPSKFQLGCLLAVSVAYAGMFWKFDMAKWFTGCGRCSRQGRGSVAEAASS
eukprot:g11483.t1